MGELSLLYEVKGFILEFKGGWVLAMTKTKGGLLDLPKRLEGGFGFPIGK